MLLKIEEFIKNNKITIFLIIVIAILILFTFLKKDKEEIKKEEVQINTITLEEYTNNPALLKTEKILVDEKNNKSIVVLHKNFTDLLGNNKYYLLIDNQKYDIERYIDDEQHLVIAINKLINNNSIVVMETKDKKEELKLEEKEYQKQDLKIFTKENLLKYKSLKTRLLVLETRLEILEDKRIQEEKVLKYLHDKVQEFQTNNDEKNLKRFNREKELKTKQIEEHRKKENVEKEEITKIKGENAELLESLKNIVDLH